MEQTFEQKILKKFKDSDDKLDFLEKKINSLEKTIVSLYESYREPNILNQIAEVRDMIYKVQCATTQLKADAEQAKRESKTITSLDDLKKVISEKEVRQMDIANFLKLDVTVVSKILSGYIHKEDYQLYNTIKIFCEKKHANIPVQVS